MLVRIEPIQIPQSWEMIKFVLRETEQIKEEFYPVYFLQVLHDLLSSYRLCYVGIQEDQYSFCCLCSFKIEPISNIKYMMIDNLYAFKPQNLDIWLQAWNDLEVIAKTNDCSVLACNTTNDRIIDIVNHCGGKLYTKTYYKFVR